MKASKWDDKLVEKLTSYYLKDNLTTLEIGKKLGFSKNAIIGKIHRLGLVKDSNKIEQTKSTKKIKEEKPTSQRKKQGQYLLFELDNAMCSWPYGGDADSDTITFCGNKIHQRSPYCKEHLDMAYLLPKKQVRKTNLDTFTEDDIIDEDIM